MIFNQFLFIIIDYIYIKSNGYFMYKQTKENNIKKALEQIKHSLLIIHPKIRPFHKSQKVIRQSNLQNPQASNLHASTTTSYLA